MAEDLSTFAVDVVLVAGDLAEVRCEGYNETRFETWLTAFKKQVKGREYVKERKIWTLPSSSLPQLGALMRQLGMAVPAVVSDAMNARAAGGSASKRPRSPDAGGAPGAKKVTKPKVEPKPKVAQKAKAAEAEATEDMTKFKVCVVLNEGANVAEVSCEKNATWLTAFKQGVEGRKWVGARNIWTCPLSSVPGLVKVMGELKIPVPANVKAAGKKRKLETDKVEAEAKKQKKAVDKEQATKAKAAAKVAEAEAKAKAKAADAEAKAAAKAADTEAKKKQQADAAKAKVLAKAAETEAKKHAKQQTLAVQAATKEQEKEFAKKEKGMMKQMAAMQKEKDKLAKKLDKAVGAPGSPAGVGCAGHSPFQHTLTAAP